VNTCFICFTYYRSDAAAPALAAALPAPAAALPVAAACEGAIPACVPSPSLPFSLDLFTGVEIWRMGMGSTFYFFCSERGFLLKKIINNRPSFGTQKLTNFFCSIPILTAHRRFSFKKSPGYHHGHRHAHRRRALSQIPTYADEAVERAQAMAVYVDTCIADLLSRRSDTQVSIIVVYSRI
jgi:hypothetical protein